MKILSWNVNGLRSIYSKGFEQWAAGSRADIICLQEVKAHETDVAHLPPPRGYQTLWNCAERKGYSGVACYVKAKPENIKTKLGHERFDREGRILELEYPKFILLNLYLPNGARDKRDIPYKLEAYKKLRAYVARLLKKNKPLLLAGDLNVARTDMDLARPQANRNNTMFTPEERGALEDLLGTGLSDTFRELHPKTKDKYTWWPYFANARPRNIGWRIDYVLASPKAGERIREAVILDKVQGSDHCPVGVEFGLEL